MTPSLPPNDRALFYGVEHADEMEPTPVTEERIIAVETSGRKGSVALAAGPLVVATRTFATNVEHARELLPSVDSLVHEQGWTPRSLTQCHLSIGPGSFTGLRVAVTFARLLATASDVRICAVPTLDVAWSARDSP